MSETCPDCRRPRVDTLAEVHDATCARDLPRVECNDSSWCELQCATWSITRLRARVAELEQIVSAGDKLCVAAIRCGVHTWRNIPPEAAHRAVEFGTRMFEYFNASATCEWPMDDTAIIKAKSPLLDPRYGAIPRDRKNT